MIGTAGKKGGKGGSNKPQKIAKDVKQGGFTNQNFIFDNDGRVLL